MVTPRESHAMAVLDGKPYAVSGSNEDDGYLSSVERYDPATDAWEAVAPMAAARESPTAAVLDGRLYAVGGYCGDGNYLSSVGRYDAATSAWEAVAPMATARDSHGVVVLDGKLYAAGGLGAGHNLLSSVERYDPALGTWEAVAPMAEARAHALAVLDGKRRRIWCRPQPHHQLGRAVRPGSGRVGGGGSDGGGADEGFRRLDVFAVVCCVLAPRRGVCGTSPSHLTPECAARACPRRFYEDMLHRVAAIGTLAADKRKSLGMRLRVYRPTLQAFNFL